MADAYSQHIAEGRLTARQGAGTRVADRAPAAEAAATPVPLAASRRALTAAPAEALGYEHAFTGAIEQPTAALARSVR